MPKVVLWLQVHMQPNRQGHPLRMQYSLITNQLLGFWIICTLGTVLNDALWTLEYTVFLYKPVFLLLECTSRNRMAGSYYIKLFEDLLDSFEPFYILHIRLLSGALWFCVEHEGMRWRLLSSAERTWVK